MALSVCGYVRIRTTLYSENSCMCSTIIHLGGRARSQAAHTSPTVRLVFLLCRNPSTNPNKGRLLPLFGANRITAFGVWPV